MREVGFACDSAIRLESNRLSSMRRSWLAQENSVFSAFTVEFHKIDLLDAFFAQD